MPQCCFAGCHNRTDDGRGLSFFRFPRRDEVRTECWVQACGRKAFVPSQHSRVCSEHFSPDDFERDIRSELLGSNHRRLRLKDTAIPSHATPLKPDDRDAGKVESWKLELSKVVETGAESAANNMAEKRPQDSLSANSFDLPPKKVFVDDDVLDLSRRTQAAGSFAEKRVDKYDEDVIFLSEDEDELMIDSLSKEIEKENAPDSESIKKSKLLLRKIENDLRNEECALMLLQQLRSSQRSHPVQPKGAKFSQNAQIAPKAIQNTSQSRPSNTQLASRLPISSQALRTSQATCPTSALPVTSTTSANPATKFTRAMATQALEQQYNGKKAVLLKHLERALDKISLPRPSGGAAFSEVAFVPSTLTNEFTSLIGLEEVISALQDFDAYSTEKSDHLLACEPFVCARCGTDFTPVWKRKRPGSTEVVCEVCIIDSQRSAIHKSYNNVVFAAVKQYTLSEKEVEQEYQDVINSPAKLDAFIRDHERKLASIQPTQTNQQQPSQQQQQQSQSTSLPSQRYHQIQNLQSQGANARRQAPSTLVSSASAPALAVSQQHPQSGHTAAASVAQLLASQYQQLSKVVAAAATGNQSQTNYTVTNNPANVTAGLMMAAAVSNPMLVAAAAANASNQQQQQQQQQATALAALQQRLAAAAALGELQQPQQTQGNTTSSTTTDQFSQFTQMQALLMNSLLCSAAATGGTQSTGNRQQQQMLQQALFQYSYILQQQQQQQQAAAAAQAQQQHVNVAALQQLMGGAVNNPATAMALLTNFWNLNAASGSASKK
ncbi:unnamed protein product [Dicrocoelium dendriticum]|nr:unnamed protein product [Dicrocoelium dendriticum]